MIDRTKAFTSQTGVTVSKGENNSIEYSEVHTNISADWSWGEITIGKDFLNWGYGKSCLLYTSPSPRDRTRYRMPSSA